MFGHISKQWVVFLILTYIKKAAKIIMLLNSFSCFHSGKSQNLKVLKEQESQAPFAFLHSLSAVDCQDYENTIFPIL